METCLRRGEPIKKRTKKSLWSEHYHIYLWINNCYSYFYPRSLCAFHMIVKFIVDVWYSQITFNMQKVKVFLCLNLNVAWIGQYIWLLRSYQYHLCTHSPISWSNKTGVGWRRLPSVKPSRSGMTGTGVRRRRQRWLSETGASSRRTTTSPPRAARSPTPSGPGRSQASAVTCRRSLTVLGTRYALSHEAFELVSDANNKHL